MYRQRFGWMVVVCFVLLLSTLSAQAPTSQAQGLPVPTATPAMCNGLFATYFIDDDNLFYSGTPAVDVVVMIGDNNLATGLGSDDAICMIGHFNDAYGEQGDDAIFMIGNRNHAYGSIGNDFISFTGDQNDGNGGWKGVDTCVATGSKNKFHHCNP